MRTVPLFPSATELVASIGASEYIVGRSHRCNHPPSIQNRPVVTESRLEERATSDASDIDAVVDDHHHGSHTYFRVIEDKLAELRPEVLITQSLCDVCAVPESMTTDAMSRLPTQPEVVSLGPMSIEGVFESIAQIGSTLDRSEEAQSAIEHLEKRIENVIESRPSASPPEHVVCLEWTDAPRCHGLWIPEIIKRLGAEDGFGEPGEHGRVIQWDQVVEYDPDVLIVSPCGRTIPEIQRDMEHLVGRDGWADLKAVRKDEVYLLDGEISSRHGPRVVRAMELIAKILYPGAFTDVSWQPKEVVSYPYA